MFVEMELLDGPGDPFIVLERLDGVFGVVSETRSRFQPELAH